MDSYGAAKGNVASKVQALESQQDGHISPNKTRSISTPTETKQTPQERSPEQRLTSKSSVRSLSQSNDRIRRLPFNAQETDHLLARLRQVTPPALETAKYKANFTDPNGKGSLDNSLSMNCSLTRSLDSFIDRSLYTGMVDLLESDAEHVLECMYEALTNALSSKHLVTSIPRSRRRLDDDRVLSSVVFIDRWVDFTIKYGLGYCLSDGSDGVYFNDATTLVMKANSK